MHPRNSLVWFVSITSLLLFSCTSKETVTGPPIYVHDTTAVSEDITSGLLVDLRLEGNAIDSSGNGFNGVSQATSGAVDRFGTLNGATSFNGQSSYIRLGDILDSVFCKPVAKFSVAGWANTNQSGTSYGGGGFIIGKNGGGSLGPYEWSLSHVDNTLRADIFFDTLANNYVRLAYPMATTSWFHFVIVFDGTKPAKERLKLYVNGYNNFNDAAFYSVGTIGTGCVNSSEELTIGAGHPSGAPTIPNNLYNGRLSDIRIYNRPLTPEEVFYLYSVH
jgi:hypothetical protein